MLEIKNFYKRVIVYLVILVVMCISISILKKYTSNKYVSNYILDGEMNYKIEAKEGAIVGDNSNKQDLFVSSTIKNILVNLDYKFNIDKKINFKYKYEINSYVISELDDSSVENKEVFRKQQKLVSTNYTENFSNVFNINDNISLNYDYYNNIANEYNYSVNIPIKSKLLLELKIYVQFENGKQKEYKNTLSLPLEKNTFSISINNKQYKGEILNSENNIKNLMLNVLAIILIIIFIFVIIFELIRFFEYKKKHYLEFKYRKIMSDYDNIVVPINALPKDNDIVSIKVLYFKSMIDIQKELHLPILCYKKDDLIIYIIINNKLAYIYFLNNHKERI